MPRRKPKDRGGRPCRYTGTAVATIVAALTRGESLETAAGRAGLGATTLYRWIALSRAGDPRYAELAEAVEGVRFGVVSNQMVDHLLGKQPAGLRENRWEKRGIPANGGAGRDRSFS